MRLSPSLEQWPPTVTAAVWKALEDRSELAAKRSSVPSEEATRVSAGLGACGRLDPLRLTNRGVPDFGCALVQGRRDVEGLHGTVGLLVSWPVQQGTRLSYSYRRAAAAV
jgi:hypothetical protein